MILGVKQCYVRVKIYGNTASEKTSRQNFDLMTKKSKYSDC